jgi:hypothetical protein
VQKSVPVEHNSDMKGVSSRLKKHQVAGFESGAPHTAARIHLLTGCSWQFYT